MIFIVYDCVIVPLQAFKVEEPFELLYATALFWALDLIRGFFTGFYKHGIIEMRPQKVWMHYVKSWFLLDFSVVLVDWIILLFLSAEDNIVALLRARRVIRLFRLMQVSKVDRIMGTIRDVLNTSAIDYGCKIAKMLFTIFGVTHAIACGWYFIASAVNDRDVNAGTWVRGEGLEGASTGILYATALHWAFAHLLLGEMDVQAVHLWERTYSVVILMVGLIVFSSFVSSITEYMSRIAQMQAENSKQDQEVRRFMEDHEISAMLTSQVDRYRRHSRTTKDADNLPRELIPGLQELPETLSVWLSEEVYQKTLTSHGFFANLQSVHPDIIALGTHRMMREQYFRKGMAVFHKGQSAQHVLVFSKGKGQYQRDDFQYTVQKGEWVSEHAIWLGGWKRRGELQATTSIEAHALDIQEFRQFSAEYVKIGYEAVAFAELVANVKVPYSQLHDVGLDLNERWSMAQRIVNLTDDGNSSIGSGATGSS
mmetsp:Transcript_118757/g.378735  ORF Transcript_118757/g.378735 Transcript_118757/m.378735 type:complete len:482 (-) Transcript_118757:28-1473(-)